jgi:hypothetical protein
MKKKNNLWEKGSKHYHNFKIQPSQFINENKLKFAEGNVINLKKYKEVMSLE